METIGDIFEEYGYVLDTHTAVAMYTAMNYKAFENENKPLIILSTASPYKFAQNVLKAITGKTIKEAFKASDMLEMETAMPVPNQIKELKTKERRFNNVIEKDQTVQAVMEFVKQ